MENFITNFVRSPTRKGKNWYFSIPLEEIGPLINTDKRYEVRVYALNSDRGRFDANFVKKPTPRGKYWYFNIPINYIRTKIIHTEENYELRVFDTEPPET